MTRSRVVVIGDGPAGLSCALQLARRRLAVTVVGNGPNSASVPAETIGPEVRLVLQRWGIRLSSGTVSSCAGIEAAWGAASSRFHSYLQGPYGSGWHCRRASFLEDFGQSMAAAAITRHRGRFIAVTRHGRAWTLTSSTKGAVESITADFVVDATGRSGLVARRLGVPRRHVDRLIAVGAVVDSALLEGLIVESVPYGWWYCSPVPGGGTLVCLVSDSDIVNSLRAIQPERWTALLRRASTICGRLGETRQPQSVRAYPCESSYLDRTGGDGWIAVGDAAAVFDPLASHGILKAFRSAERAANAIASAVDGDVSAIERYHEARQAELEHYFRARRAHYQLESRWPNEPFWRRRLQA